MHNSQKKQPYINLPGISPWKTRLDTLQNQQRYSPPKINTHRFHSRTSQTRATHYISQNLSRCHTRKVATKNPQTSYQKMVLGPICLNYIPSNRKQTMIVMKQNKPIEIQKPPIENAICIRMFQSQNNTNNQHSLSSHRQYCFKQNKIQFRVDYHRKNQQTSRKFRLI